MSASPRASTSSQPTGSRDSDLDESRATCWRQQQQINSLNETIVVYRQGANTLATVIAELRHELAAAHSLHTRRQTEGTLRRVEVTLAADEDAPAVVSLAVGDALGRAHSARAVQAWQVLASELTDNAVLRYGATSEAMLLLRISCSPTAVGIEILAP